VRSRLRGVWGDLNLGSLTLVSITTYKEVDSIKTHKTFLRKPFIVEKSLKTISEKKKAERELPPVMLLYITLHTCTKGQLQASYNNANDILQTPQCTH